MLIYEFSQGFISAYRITEDGIFRAGPWAYRWRIGLLYMRHWIGDVWRPEDSGSELHFPIMK